MNAINQITARLERAQHALPELTGLESPEVILQYIEAFEQVLEGAGNASLQESPEFIRELKGNPGSVLICEGIANDLSGHANRIRKLEGLNVSDEVTMEIVAGAEVSWAIYWNLARLLSSTKSIRILLNRVSSESLIDGDGFHTVKLQAVSEATFAHLRILR